MSIVYRTSYHVTSLSRFSDKHSKDSPKRETSTENRDDSVSGVIEEIIRRAAAEHEEIMRLEQTAEEEEAAVQQRRPKGNGEEQLNKRECYVVPAKSNVERIDTAEALITVCKTKPPLVIPERATRVVPVTTPKTHAVGYESAFLSFISETKKTGKIKSPNLSTTTTKRSYATKPQIMQNVKLTGEEERQITKKPSPERKSRKNSNPKNLKDINRLSVQDASNVSRETSPSVKLISPMPVLTTPDTVPFVQHENMPTLDPPCVQSEYVFSRQAPVQTVYNVTAGGGTPSTYEIYAVDKNTTFQDCQQLANAAQMQTLVAAPTAIQTAPVVAYGLQNVQNNFVYGVQNGSSTYGVLQQPATPVLTTNAVYVQNVVQQQQAVQSAQTTVRKPNLIWTNHKYYTVNSCQTEYENESRFYPMSMQPITLDTDDAAHRNGSSHILEENVLSTNQENIENNVKKRDGHDDFEGPEYGKKSTAAAQYYSADIENYPKIYEQMMQKLESELSSYGAESDTPRKMMEVSTTAVQKKKGCRPRKGWKARRDVKTDLSEQLKNLMRHLTPLKPKLELHNVMEYLSSEQRSSLKRHLSCLIPTISSCLVAGGDGTIECECEDGRGAEGRASEKKIPPPKKVRCCLNNVHNVMQIMSILLFVTDRDDKIGGEGMGETQQWSILQSESADRTQDVVLQCLLPAR